MSRVRSVYVCGSCGYQNPRWLGRCPDCGEWNTLVEEAVAPVGAGRRPVGGAVMAAPTPISLADVDALGEERIPSGIAELDRVLGGGFVRGSLVLVGGEPGIGKSTLLLQSLLAMGAAGVSTLLVSGEESAAQVKLRARRLSAGLEQLRLIGETRVESVLSCLEEHSPQVCVVDSIQTLWSAAVNSAPGAVSQVREVTGQLLRMAKEREVTLVLVGHVTKTGDLAGPRVLEHMVDAVLGFEGDRSRPYRILRAVKNRFGATDEVGVFQMTGQGLIGVPDPSALFLEEGDDRAGSSVMAAMEGSRCLLAEVQALVAPSALAMPRRVARGIDHNRLAMLLAVLSRRVGIDTGACDIFVNVAGGMTVDDPAADLPVLLAVASAFRDRALGQVAAFGEVSLTGQVRYVVNGELRLAELARHGFERVLVPRRNAQELRGRRSAPAGTTVQEVGDIGDLVRGVLG